MEVEIRTATHDDVDGIRTVAERAWHAAHAPIVGEETVESFLDDYYDRASFRSLVDDGSVLLRVAEGPDGSVVGFASARPDDGDAATFHLGRIYVRPDRWGEGVGRRLLVHVEEAVRRRGGSRILLGVMAENDRAVGFYEAAGYRREDEVYDDGIDAASYRYRKPLE